MKNNMLFCFLLLTFGTFPCRAQDLFFCYDESGNRTGKYTIACLVLHEDDHPELLQQLYASGQLPSELEEQDAPWETGVYALDQQAHVKFYPNPTTDQVHFLWSHAEQDLEGVLYNARGKRIRRFRVNSKEYHLDLRGHPSGKYLVSMHGKAGEHQLFTIIKH